MNNNLEPATSDPSPNQKSKRFLVTGGAGFIGSNFILYMLGKYPKLKITNLDKLTYAGNLENLKSIENDPRYTFIHGDICEKKTVDKAMQGCDGVVHFAAESIPEHIYLPIQSTPSIGTRLLTFGELWKEQSKNNKPKKNPQGETIYLKGKQTKALSFLNGGQWMPIKAITRHWYEGKIVKLKQKWGVVEATPNHSIYSANLELTNPEANPEVLVVRDVNEIRKKGRKVSENLLKILAAYITEGNATFNKANGGYIVEIGQQNKDWLAEIGRAIASEFGLKSCIIKHRKKQYQDVFALQISNKDFFDYLISNCGKGCSEKHFPDWIFDLETKQREVFWEKLLEGDGTRDGRYSTTSYKLANQIGLLLALQNKKYCIFEYDRKGCKRSWEFKTELSGQHYGLNQRKKVEIDYEGWVYDLEVEKTHNFICGIGNIVCHNTHVDRSITGPAEFIRTNVIGTQVLLDGARENKIKRFHHVSCYDEQTRALTRDGLKYYRELSDKDAILSLNLKTREIEWKKIAKVIIQDYDGSMIKIKSDRVDLLVTPNHRILLQTGRDNLLFKEAQHLGSRNFLPRGVWKGKKTIGPELMYLLGFFIGDGFLAYQEKETPSLTGLTKCQYIALGRNKENGQFTKVGVLGAAKKVISKSYRVFLDVPEKDSARGRVENTLSNLEIKWHAHKGKSGEHIYFNSEKFSEFFKQCGHRAKNKQIPLWALEENTKNLQALFDGLIDSDGRRTYNGISFTTSSQKLAEGFAQLCIKLGTNPHIFNKNSVGNHYRGRIIKGGTSYHITVAKTKRSIIPRYELNHVTNTAYKGKVWCVKVPENKNLLVERNGIFSFCGNTDEVFGSLELKSKKKFDENTPYDPHSPYSASKAASDHLVRAYHDTYGLPITISNCTNNYGPLHFPEKVIPLFITNAMQGKSLPIYGRGKAVRDYLFVEDHCVAIDLVLQKGKIGETYCIGGDSELNTVELATAILKAMGKSKKLMRHVEDRKGHDMRYAMDHKKISKELGWKPKVDFEEGLKQTIKWFEENEKWWKRIISGEYLDSSRKKENANIKTQN